MLFLCVANAGITKSKEPSKMSIAGVKTTPSVCKFQNQASRVVLIKRCSENMQQIYRRTPMPKCDFDKVPKQLY